jgi:hypothetical protein
LDVKGLAFTLKGFDTGGFYCTQLGRHIGTIQIGYIVREVKKVALAG